MEQIELFLGTLLAGFGTLLFLTSTIAWKRTGSGKIGLIALALLIFALKGIFLTITGILFEYMAENVWMLMMDISIIILIYLSVLKG